MSNSQATPNALEQTEITLGYMALTDSAPVIIAKELGYFERHGLNVSLERQRSWATMRDKLHAGIIDAANMLAPIPLASTLGLGSPKIDVVAPMVLSQNGNAITISKSLYQLLKAKKGVNSALPINSLLFKQLVTNRAKINDKLTFATVYPYSCHYYQLVSWLDSHQISKDMVDLVVIPPEKMVVALQNNEIDGFCVGGPWNAKAVRDGVGITCATSCDIWPDMPEKVLAILESWYQKHPNTAHALIRALYDACRWLISMANRFEAAKIISEKGYVDVDIATIAPSLIGSCIISCDSSPRQVPNYNRFASDTHKLMNQPDSYAGQWLINHMMKNDHLVEGTKVEPVIAKVFRHDIFNKAIG